MRFGYSRAAVFAPVVEVQADPTVREGRRRPRWSVLPAALLLAFAALTAVLASAQEVHPQQAQAEAAVRRFGALHRPGWAQAANQVRVAAADEELNQMILVMARTAEQQTAFEKFLTDQQDPQSADFHHWLTPAEIKQRFGPADEHVESVSGWLRGHGLKVNSVAPSGMFIGFRGTAAAVNSAFAIEMRYYKGEVAARLAPATAPAVPAEIAPRIKAVHGLYTIGNRPLHNRAVKAASPLMNSSSGEHYVSPADFDAIYNASGGFTGATIGIVGRARVFADDLYFFASRTNRTFYSYTEIVPTAFGGVDPGPALGDPPADSDSIADQGEATLDVQRAGSVAPGAKLLLVVATQDSGGIEVAAQYLVETTPTPASVISISFGKCEAEAGAAGVNFWDALFQQAAAQGISSFVSSGDSGASGCDQHFVTPPVNPVPNSPNYICSSSYATCVGGTEFNDTADPSLYWSSTNTSSRQSVLGYIPEGAWNEPLDDDAKPRVAATGGGVSSVIATPNWQTGTGVPAERTGRYTPDISFTAASHDAYYGCFAAGGGGCQTSSDGKRYFVGFSGTSASAPSMAGVASRLATRWGGPRGNLNPRLYAMAADTPTAFHDATPATSGVANCDVNTPSMCNNSIPGPDGLTGGQAGYPVTVGYDLATGLGSLDVNTFLEKYSLNTGIIRASSATVEFRAKMGHADLEVAQFENVGSDTLLPPTLSITGPAASDFSLMNPADCSTGVAPAGVCRIPIDFHPGALGPRIANLSISVSNAANSPQVVTLSGTGVAAEYMLDVGYSRYVTVSSTDGYINCGDAHGDCVHHYPEGTQVTLKVALTAPGSVFRWWYGDCSGTGDCVLTLTRDMYANALTEVRTILVLTPNTLSFPPAK